MPFRRLEQHEWSARNSSRETRAQEEGPADFRGPGLPGQLRPQQKTVNTEAAKNILAAAQVPKVEKSPTFVGFA